MNKTITEMKTSEGVDSRIAEAELISDMEDRMVEISAMEQNLKKKKKKEWNKMKTVPEASRTMPTFKL